MLENCKSKPGMANLEILRNIVGYSTLIETPFGQKCSVYADHTATGRPFKMIEEMVQEKIKPMIANSHSETSLMGYFSTQLLHYAETSILKSFKVSKATHFSVPTGNGATGAFERLTKILRVAELSQKQRLMNPQLEKSLNPNVPCVYITPYEHHSNILPWQISGCNLLKIEGDKYGNMRLETLEKTLKQNVHFKIQIISVSATSNVTSQRTDLEKLNKIIKKYKQEYLQPGYKVIFIVDGAAFCSHNRLNLSEEGLSEIDFVCISPHKHLGGSESTGVLIAKLSAYDLTLPPSFPGGGTVKAVVGLEQEHTWYDNDPTAREMPGTPNAIGFYRAALTFELQDYIGLDYILEKEEHNATYFFNRIQKINEEFLASEQIPPRRVHIYGDPDISKRYDVFSFNIYGPGTNTDASGKSVFHPNFVARGKYLCELMRFHSFSLTQFSYLKVLNDIFGIQVRSGCSCAGPYGVLLLGIPERRAVEIVGDLLQGYEDVKPGWVRLDTFFSMDQYDLDYIIEAIRLIALNGERLMRMYEANPKTAQFHLKSQSHPTFDFSLKGLQKENITEIPIEERRKYLADQMEIGKNLLENPESYIRENFPQISQAIQDTKDTKDGKETEGSSNGSHNILLDQSRSSGISEKSHKIENVSFKNVKYTPQPPQQSHEEKKQMRNLIGEQVREELRNMFADHPLSGDYKSNNSQVESNLQEQNLKTSNIYKRQGDQNEKSRLVEQIFKTYAQSNKAEAAGVTSVSMLQFSQDYHLLSSQLITVNDLLALFQQITNDQSSSNSLQVQNQLSLPQFSAFLENLAVQIFSNNPGYPTLSSKIDAFFHKFLQMRKSSAQATKHINQPTSQPINWHQSAVGVNPRERFEYSDKKNNPRKSENLPLSFLENKFSNLANPDQNLSLSISSPTNNMSSKTMKLNTQGSSNIFHKGNYQPTPPPANANLSGVSSGHKNNYYANFFNPSRQVPVGNTPLSMKESILKRADQIHKYQTKHEQNLYAFVSK